MTRLIDADALLEAVKVIGNRPLPDVRTLKDLEQAIVNTYHAILNEITNAPTVQRELAKSYPKDCQLSDFHCTYPECGCGR